MESRSWALEMTLYSKWQNEELYGLCSALGQEALLQDRGMFFGSLQHTLDHILMVDVALRNFFEHAQPPVGFDPQKRMYDTFHALHAARTAFDQALLDLFSGQAEDWLNETISFDSERLGRQVQIPRQFYVMQMFNHGTHHRSQVTSELHRMGIDYGNTDMPYNPYSRIMPS